MTTRAFNEAFEKVKNLAENFHAHIDRYCSSDYKEADVRLDFIDPFLDALGWKRGQNPYQQELKIERHAQSGTQKRADYAFYIAPRCSDGDERFFLEAKKPHDNIATPAKYFQTISYGYSSRTPLAVLTDFEEFHILDCRSEPKLKTALDHCVDKFDYTDYLDRDKFAKIYWLFSREAFTSGSFDATVKQLRGKKTLRAPKPVDESLLERLDELRNALAHAFKKHNPELDSEALTEFAQRTLDRLVFLRFLEDKGIERQGTVTKLAGSATAWRDFIARCRQLDSIYNGIIYRPQPTLDAPTFRMDNAAFAEVCKRLAHGDSDYNFNFDFIPIHVLGSIYERFLGKVIVATDKRVRVEDKPEVRKAGGVYYTPDYIVHYIVENTVGKLVAGKTPDQIAEMRFADIACGSGSFLLGVYDLLLTYHGTWYNTNRSKARKGDCFEHDGKLYLTLAKKRDILVKNIYGVDIDAQAVEVCQLSLCLKLLKDESPETTAQYLLDFEHTAQMKKLLPDLSKNIVCGNSLIGRDILEGQLFEPTEEKKLNPMNFKGAFPEVMNRGGFDAIVGNPPYRKERDSREFITDLKKSKFGGQYYEGKMDLWYFFLHRAILITKPAGLISFIVPSYWLKGSGASKLRRHLREDCTFRDVVDFGKNKVFREVSGKHMTFLLARGKQPSQVSYQHFVTENLSPGDMSEVLAQKCAKRSQVCRLDEATIFTPQNEIDFGRGPFLALLARLGTNTFALEDDSAVFTVSQGIVEATDSVTRSAAENVKRLDLIGKGVFVLSPSEARQMRFNECEREFVKRYLRAADVSRYHFRSAGYVVFYIGNEDNRKIRKERRDYPNITAHLDRYKDFVTSSNRPYGIHRTRESRFFTAEKLLCPNMFDRPCFAYCQDEYYVNFAFNVVIAGQNQYSLKYLLGLLNSRLGAIWFDLNGKKRGVNNDIGVAVMRRFPVRRIDFSDAADKSRHDRVVALVEAMLAAKKELAGAKTGNDITFYENKCADIDHQIDALVYDLYGLTENEIKIVKDSLHEP